MTTMTRLPRLLAALIAMTILALGLYAVPQVSGDDNKDKQHTEEATELLKKAGELFEFKAPTQLGDGFTLTPNGKEDPITVTRLDTSGNPAEGSGEIKADGMAAYYPDEKSLAIPFGEDGVYAILEIIEDADSPDLFQYRIDIGDGRDILGEEDGSGGYKVTVDGETVVRLGAPWAVDSEGKVVETYYMMEGKTLTLKVDHKGLDYMYPIVADPCWKVWKGGCGRQIAESAAATGQPVVEYGMIATTVTTLTVGPAGGAAVGAASALVGLLSTIGGGIHCMATCDP